MQATVREDHRRPHRGLGSETRIYPRCRAGITIRLVVETGRALSRGLTKRVVCAYTTRPTDSFPFCDKSFY
ncbi:hypothetical protein EVAR_14230_1 [Eumeta japonica]|uniref:Uncharacterized protein n=1 Tax=Eumeta variegata TaxID=151549 RepID=A0A4C1WA08_EUMVA|nr:hypothetical protein EVAR_14230_1 [Eumeta japonica]